MVQFHFGNQDNKAVTDDEKDAAADAKKDGFASMGQVIKDVAGIGQKQDAVTTPTNSNPVNIPTNTPIKPAEKIDTPVPKQNQDSPFMIDNLPPLNTQQESKTPDISPIKTTVTQSSTMSFVPPQQTTQPTQKQDTPAEEKPVKLSTTSMQQPIIKNNTADNKPEDAPKNIDPMITMRSLSKQIKAYVDEKQGVIAGYKQQIQEYENKIKDVQRDLKEHQKQFQSMIHEIDTLTKSLNNNQPPQSKQKKGK